MSEIEPALMEEEILLRTRPSPRSFLVFFIGMAVCLLGPLLKENSPFSLETGALISVFFLAVIIKRWSNLYTLTNRRLIVNSSLPGRAAFEIALEDIREIDVRQGLTLRLLGTGHVLVSSRRPDQSNLVLYGLIKPHKFRERLEALAPHLTE